MNRITHILDVCAGDLQDRVPYTPGASLKALLERSELAPRSECNGNGSCGLCKVRVTSGQANPLTRNERVNLTDTQIEEGVRLACQLFPAGDMTVSVINQAPSARWHASDAILCTNLIEGWPGDAGRTQGGLGIVADIGTTNLSMALVEPGRAKTISVHTGLNPQAKYGTDILTRLTLAAGSATASAALSQVIIAFLADGIHQLASTAHRSTTDIGEVVVVGNTAMLSLLLQGDHKTLLTPTPRIPANPWTPPPAGHLRTAFGIHPDALVRVLDPLAGFVGSDLLAGLVATRLTHCGGAALFIDFGTNSEIALWTGEALHVTSAAGGPAFEGCGITCGIPVGPGAAYHVDFPGGPPRLHTVRGQPARGVCGSGMVDLLNGLRANGTLQETGVFSARVPGVEFSFTDGDTALSLTKRDVDMFQRAKAAVATGIQALFQQSGLTPESLDRIFIGGTFGQYLDIGNAQQLGLIPSVPAMRVELCGNTALAGGICCLRSAAATEHLQAVRRTAHCFNLARWPDFNTDFMKHLYLRPFEANA